MRHFVELAGLVTEGALAQVTTSVADLTGKPPRSIEAFLAEHREQLLAPVKSYFEV
ncbi:hypothetical protein GCM10027271_34580 [Saccharopolyspora gloriosae]|uniref:Uncharacterized protein n=1 Tax=Saccharopolyspora gloriosae TaxID=455344 RepID=A0A840NCJ5_9PSEU|nr:hypothetical protein [Saccharopolyspora gloriosae]MBB5069650.1 hypothetical protein [Saccharopolyspora gloriosae]